ncbi:cytochrome P450 [Trichoderma austrokoningii]
MAISELLSSVSSSQIWTFGALFLVVTFIIDFVSGFASHPPSHIPSMGKNGIFNSFIDSFRAIKNYNKWVKDGYSQFGRKGLPFIVPQPLSGHSEVVLPRSQVAWLVDQPDNVLSTYDAHNTSLFTRYNFLGRRLAHDPFPNRVMHKHLARHLTTVIPNVDEETQFVVSAMFGDDTENWKSFTLWNMWLAIVPRVINRLLVGPELCRNKQFVDNMTNFSNDVVRNMLILQLLPKVLHPVVGRLLSIFNYMHWRSADAVVQPLVQERLNSMLKHANKDVGFEDYAPPEDYVTWTIRQALAENKTFELNSVILSKRLLPIEFAAIHTTVLTGQLWMQDLLSSDPETGILDMLRAEIKANKPKSGPWTKAALSNLVRLDSSIRESQRLSNFSSTMVERKVVSENGVYNPDLDLTFPKGSWVVLNMEGTHHCEYIYENAQSYDPLRYSRMREAWDAKSDEEKKDEPGEGTRMRGLGMVTTSPQHLAFGHGRHACPARFFVSHEFKLILATIILDYDIRMTSKKGERRWIGSTVIPPKAAEIQIRKRKVQV